MQLFQNISYLDFGEGEMREAWGAELLTRGRGSQVESKPSLRKMLIEILDNRRFIGGDSVS